ncbi:hypothetical protein AB0K48_07375, partial [Nonomuraea sp. NPDC055795]
MTALVKIPPEGAGRLHRLRLDEAGEREGLVSWIEDVREGFTGGLKERLEWMPLRDLDPLDGVDYTRVPWDRPAGTTSPAAVDDGGRRLPDAWPASRTSWDQSDTGLPPDAFPQVAAADDRQALCQPPPASLAVPPCVWASSSAVAGRSRCHPSVSGSARHSVGSTRSTVASVGASRAPAADSAASPEVPVGAVILSAEGEVLSRAGNDREASADPT